MVLANENNFFILLFSSGSSLFAKVLIKGFPRIQRVKDEILHTNHLLFSHLFSLENVDFFVDCYFVLIQIYLSCCRTLVKSA